MADRLKIRERDQKTLWARAAGRCAFATCRAELTLDKDDGSGLTLGAMAHIVADSDDGPRGKSDLTDDERRAYSNLVLLCSHHHDVIDTDISAYEVAKLHTIKADHEQWVTDSLAGAGAASPDDLFWAHVIDTIEEQIPFGNWRGLVDSLVRDQLPLWMVESRGALNELKLRAVWPDNAPDLKGATESMLQAFSDYVSHFEEGSYLRHKMLVRDVRYKHYVKDFYKREKAALEVEKWSWRSYCLLADWVVKLNHLADAIRAHLNPMYRRTEGYFVIFDDLGVRGDGISPTIWRPEPDQVATMMTWEPGMDENEE